MRILVISGSRRERSYSRVLARIACDYAREKGEDAEFLDLGVAALENFRGFDAGYSPETQQIIEQVERADVLIICSPIYDGLLSSAIKNLFEHINYKSLEGKAAGIVLMSEGQISYLQVQGQLQALMNYFRVVSAPRAAYVDQKDFDKDLNLTNETKVKRLMRVVDEAVELKSRPHS